MPIVIESVSIENLSHDYKNNKLNQLCLTIFVYFLVLPWAIAPTAVKDNEITNHTINKLLLKQQVLNNTRKAKQIVNNKTCSFDLPLLFFWLL